MRRVLRIGHRGATGHAPENTLAEIQTGIALGVDFVEVDARSTADGVGFDRALNQRAISPTCRITVTQTG